MAINLEVILPLIEIAELEVETTDDQQLIESLRKRLRAANKATRKLVRLLHKQVEASPEEVERLTNALANNLSSMDIDAAKAYLMVEFTPEHLHEIEKISRVSYVALLRVIKEYCLANGIPLVYEIWSQG